MSNFFPINFSHFKLETLFSWRFIEYNKSDYNIDFSSVSFFFNSHQLVKIVQQNLEMYHLAQHAIFEDISEVNCDAPMMRRKFENNALYPNFRLKQSYG